MKYGNQIWLNGEPNKEQEAQLIDLCKANANEKIAHAGGKINESDLKIEIFNIGEAPEEWKDIKVPLSFYEGDQLLPWVCVWSYDAH